MDVPPRGDIGHLPSADGQRIEGVGWKPVSRVYCYAGCHLPETGAGASLELAAGLGQVEIEQDLAERNRSPKTSVR